MKTQGRCISFADKEPLALLCRSLNTTTYINRRVAISDVNMNLVWHEAPAMWTRRTNRLKLVYLLIVQCKRISVRCVRQPEHAKIKYRYIWVKYYIIHLHVFVKHNARRRASVVSWSRSPKYDLKEIVQSDMHTVPCTDHKVQAR